MNQSSTQRWTVLTAATLFGLSAGIGAAEQPRTTTTASVATPLVSTTATKSLAIDPRFAALDKDGDASLLQSDIPAGHDLSTDLFASFDTDQDQRISSAEFAVYAGGNDDGMVEEDEEEAE